MKLIQIKDYLLLIDEEVVCKTGELYLTSILNRIIPKCKGVIQAGDKIIAYLPINSEAKELEGLPLLPPFENDNGLEKSLNKYIKDLHSQEECIGFIDGYKAAQKSKGQYSLEDIKVIAIKFAEHCKSLELLGNHVTNYEELYDDSIKEIGIQSLSNQQLPKSFNPEPNDIGYMKNADIMVGKKLYDKIMSPFKTIINSEGKEELVGNYVY